MWMFTLLLLLFLVAISFFWIIHSLLSLETYYLFSAGVIAFILFHKNTVGSWLQAFWDPTGKKQAERSLNWPAILRFIYTNQEKWIYYGKGKNARLSTEHPIQKELGLDKRLFDAGISFLIEMGLIEERNGDWILTSRGFDTIQKRELEEEHVKTNKVLTVATLSMALMAFFQAATGLYTIENPLARVAMAAMFLVYVGVFYYVVRKRLR